MSIINRNNYEAYYLDYLEHNLNSTETAALFSFLDANPDLKSEVEGVSVISLSPESRINFDSSVLKQPVLRGSIEDSIIARIEGVIDEEDAEELDRLLKKDQSLQELLLRYEKTLMAPEEVEFPNKQSLKKEPQIFTLINLSIAASLLILFVFYTIDQNEANVKNTLVSSFNENYYGDSLPSNRTSIEDNHSQKKDSEATEINKNLLAIVPDERKSTNEKASEPSQITQSIQNKVKSKVSLNSPRRTNLLYGNNEYKESLQPTIINEVGNVGDNTLTPSTVGSIKNENHKIVEVERTEKLILEKTFLSIQHPMPTILPFEENTAFDETNALKNREAKQVLLAVISEKIDQKTGAEMSYDYDEKKTSFKLTIGKFEFSRTKRRRNVTL